ncbi:MAG: peptidoglycan DD-metalloendopeptidase family protein, partial [Chloroflexota bacterium]
TSTRPVLLAPARPASAVDRFASHGLILSVALLAVFASGLGLPKLLPEAAESAQLELPSWPEQPRTTLPLDSGRQNVQKVAVPVTQTAAESSNARAQVARLQSARNGVTTYAIQDGDTLSGIAAKFNITTQTLVWSNEVASPDDLKLGQEIRIPPTSGVLHRIKQGDTLSSIADKYKVEGDKFVAYANNELIDPDALVLGQEIMVAGGVKPAEPVAQVATRQSDTQVRGGGTVLPPAPQSTAGGLFQWPTYGPIYGWYGGGHRGLDISPPYGTPVYAAEAGTVISMSYLNDGYGLHVSIDHGNGYQTLYAHLSEAVVRSGDAVVRGQHIGRVGTTGRVTGPHLHFEVHNNGFAIDPLRTLPR